MTKKQDAPPPSLLGKALVAEGVVSEEQLDRALRVQRYLEQPRQIGSILIEFGYATKRNIADVLQKHGGGMRLGEILLEQELVSVDALERALVAQEERGLKLGEALVELGVVKERTLLQTLAQQAGVPYIEPVFSMLDTRLLQGVSPEYLETNQFVPFSADEDGTVTVVASNIDDEKLLLALGELYQDKYRLALGPQDSIAESILDFRRFRQSPQGDEFKAGIKQADDSIVNLLEHIICSAIDERASDIHIEPMSTVIRLRYRIDGVLAYKTDLPLNLLPRLISRIKILADCNITEHQRHQGGRILFSHKGVENDLRLSLFVTIHGECAVLRILNKQKGLIELDELGMCKPMMERFCREVLDAPTGVVLITGPTGSGKTTTLYSCLNYSNSIETKIITAEDPVEFTIDGLIQCSIYDKIGRTFQATLREIVRQDPDIIVLGEIRDQISAQTAIQAALTGHKVYSTFHTEDTIGGLIRLIDMDIETFLISSTVISVVAQRLPRRICEYCAVPYTPTVLEISRLGLDMLEVYEFELTKGRGCKHCNYTGYYGRVGVYELLIMNEDVKEAILLRKSSESIRETCSESTGLISMREDGVAKVVRGETTFEEVLRHTPYTSHIRSLSQILALTQ